MRLNELNELPLGADKDTLNNLLKDYNATRVCVCVCVFSVTFVFKQIADALVRVSTVW